MKHKINSISMMLLFLIGAMSCSLVACSDKDSAGQPEITGVKILTNDTTNYSYDEYYTKAGPGTMIAVMGKNLGSALQLFINGQELTFNPTMNTDHSLIATIPTEEKGFRLSSFDSTVPDEIRIVTEGGSATYQFKVTAPSPQLQRIQALYPRKQGDAINLYGLNLVDIEKAYFTDLTSDEIADAASETIGGNHVDISDLKTIVMDHHLTANNAYVTNSQLQFNMPQLPYATGTLVLECVSGTTYMPFYTVPGQPTITAITSDMPQIGEDLVIDGTEFVQVESIQYGDVTLTAADFTVNAEETQIVIPFTKKPTSGSAATLTVTTPGGKVSVDRFYDYSTILTTFDGDATNNGWAPDAAYTDSGTADGIFAHINVPEEAQQWWGMMVYYRKDWNGNSFALSDNIPSTATADEVYLAVNVLSNSDYNNGTFRGYIRYMIQPIGDKENQYDIQLDWENYDEQIPLLDAPGVILADANGEAPVGCWYRHVLPLSKFACYKDKTYSDIKTTGLNQFRMQSINQSTTRGKVDVKFDNVRVIYIPKK